MAKKSIMKKQHITILTVVIVLLTGLVFIVNTKNQIGKTNNQKESLSIENTNADLEDHITFSKYFPQETLKSTTNPGHLQYNFTDGQPKRRNIYNNYSIVFPKSWTLFTYTNEMGRDDYGTNLLLKKGNNYLIVKQQLFESGTCLFDSSLELTGMSYRCNLIESLNKNSRQWKIYTAEKETSNTWQKFSVCDQNAYSEEISSYTEPTELDKALCSPWTNVGEISFYFSETDQDTYNEFVEIVKSIEIIK